MIKKIETPVVSMTTVMKMSWECERCAAKFNSEYMAQEHGREKHSYTNKVELDGYLGNDDELPPYLRGSTAYRFDDQDGFILFGGAKSDWKGTGWYIQSSEFIRCNRCLGYGCGHSQTNMTRVDDRIYALLSFGHEIIKTIRSIRKLP